jgi:hypothetical protein
VNTPLTIFVVLDGILFVVALLWLHRRLSPRVQAAFDRTLTRDDDDPLAEPQSLWSGEAESQTAPPADHEAIQRMRDRWAKEAQS